MPTSPEALTGRLEAIGRSLANSGHGIALIGLGSVGLELSRLDPYSDLDFFAIVEDGWKSRFIDDLSWLSAIAPISYCFRNTVDGYKLLFLDGIFCEFAVFETAELRAVPFAPGRIVWSVPSFDSRMARPSVPVHPPVHHDLDWVLGEALTNLYVGLGRYARGERLSAFRFVQSHAVDRVLELASRGPASERVPADLFSRERRFEDRFPEMRTLLPSLMLGYDKTPDSAEVLLTYLEEHHDVNRAIAAEIRKLVALCR